MRPILLLSLVGALSAPAAAGDISIGFGYRDGGRHGVSVAFGYSNGHNHGYRNSYQRWVPGHYETVHRQVWVPGACEQVWQAAQYEWRYDSCGCRRVRVLVRPAGYVTVQRPGYYQTVCDQVWVPGRYVRC